MTMRFTIEALAHVADIRTYIEKTSPSAAAFIVDRIFAEVDRLGQFPHLGHLGAVPGTYEWIVPRLPYIIVHEFADNDQLIVLGVFHGARHR
jgi:plasmid stabilization system protein ParE